MEQCAQCGAASAGPAEIEVEATVAGEARMFRVPGARCGACGAAYAEEAGALAFERQLAAAHASAGVPDGVAFRSVRNALGYDQKELGALLDVAPETILRWEKGERAPGRAARALLAMMMLERVEAPRSTRTADALAALRDGRSLARTG